MTPVKVRHAMVALPDGRTVYRGDVLVLPDDEVERLTALGAVVDPDESIDPVEDPRPWAEVVQEMADARYDKAPT